MNVVRWLSFLVILSLFTSCTPTPEEDLEIKDGLEDSFVTKEGGEVEPPAPSCFKDVYEAPKESITRKLDILIVPDTSASIKQERKRIAEGFDYFVSALPEGVDFNIGVILGHSGKSNKSGKLYKKNSKDALVLKSSELSLKEIQDALSLKIHNPKTDGSSDGGEMGMYSILEALKDGNLQEIKSKGLLRDDAALAVIFVADEQDICAQAPEGITLKVDPQNGERKSFVKYCIEENLKWKDVNIGGSEYSYKITPQIVLDRLREVKGNMPLVVGGVLYDEASTIPTGNEDEIGYGYLETVRLAKGINVDLGSGDYRDGLKNLGKLATTSFSAPQSFDLGVIPDLESLRVYVDDVLVEYTYDPLSNKVFLVDDRDNLSVVRIEYIEESLSVLTNLKQNQRFNEPLQVLEVSATGKNLLTTVTLNDVLLISSTSRQIVLPISLANGANNVYVETKDTLSNETVSELILVTLNTPPVINLTTTEKSGIAPWTVGFNITNSTDDDGISLYELVTNGESVISSNGDFSFTYSNAGNFEAILKITDTDGLVTTQTVNQIEISTNKGPIANFETSSFLIEQDGLLTINATNSFDDEQISSYTVNWGDGTSETQTTPLFSKQYENSGNYRVSLSITDRQGLTSVKSQDISVKAKNLPPNATFTSNLNRVNPGVTIDFDATGSSDDNTISSYQWVLGNEGSLKSRVPKISTSFLTSGPKKIDLVVLDNNGVSSPVFSKNIEINFPPVAKILTNLEFGNPPLSVNLNASGSSDDQSIETYKWKINGNIIYEGPVNSLQTTLTEEGISLIELEVIDNEGLSHKASKEIRVNSPPVITAIATPETGDYPLVVNLKGSALDDSGIASTAWILQDGTELAGNEHTLTLETEGTYNFTFKVIDEDGLETSVAKTVAISPNPSPVSQISGNRFTGIAPVSLSFSGKNSTDDKLIEEYKWTINGEEIYGQELEKEFLSSGIFNLSLSVKDNQGKVDSTTRQIEIINNNPPVAALNLPLQNLYAPSALEFDASNSTDDEKIVRYEWDFGNGESVISQGPKVSQIFTETGAFNIRLRVLDRQGLYSDIEKTLNLEQTPEGLDLTPPSITLENYLPLVSDPTQSFIFLLNDESGIDFRSIVLKLNNTKIDSSQINIDPLLRRVEFLPNANNPFKNFQKNILSFEVVDSIGNFSAKGFDFDFQNPISIDNAGPNINFSPNEGILEDLDFNLQISFFDVSGVDLDSVELKLGTEQIPESSYIIDPINKIITVSFDENFALDLDQINVVSVRVSDLLGNEKELGIGFDSASRFIIPPDEPGVLLANFGSDVITNCVIVDDGKVRCWGDGRNDGIPGGTRYGYSQTTPIENAPYVDIPEKVIKIVSRNGIMALTESGKVYAWGTNGSGSLGYGNTETIGDNETPAQAGPLPLTKDVKNISSWGRATCAVAIDDSFSCWGVNSNSRLGYESDAVVGDNESLASLDWYSYGKEVKDITLSSLSVCVLFADGEVRCFGNTNQGTIGYDNYQQYVGSYVPVDQSFPMKLGGLATEITSGSGHYCVLFDNGKGKCWGRNNGDGALGRGDSELFISSKRYVEEEDFLDLPENIREISAGGAHTCAITVTDKLICWGVNDGGQLGYGTIEPGNDFSNPNGASYSIGDDEPPFTQGYVDLGEPVKHILPGNRSTCIQTMEDKMKCWQYNFAGQIGQNSTSQDYLFTPVKDIPYVQLGTTLDPQFEIQSGPAGTNLAIFEISPLSGVYPLDVQFTGSEDSSISLYEWNFGNGIGLSTINNSVTHTYSNTGVFFPELKVYDSNNNLIASFSRVVNVLDPNNPPVANLEISSNDINIPETVIFDGSGSFDSSGIISSYIFDFGNGESVTSPTPIVSYAYDANGVYLSSLKVVDDNGNISQESTQVIYAFGINQAPVADFHCDPSGYGVHCFATQAFDYDGRVLGYSWEYGDGATSVGEDSSHTYNTPGDGTYLVSLSVVDNNGEVSKIEKSVNVDFTKPIVTSPIETNQLTNLTSFTLPLEIIDQSNTVSTVFLNNAIVGYYEGNSLSIPIMLSEGSNRIEVSTMDGGGNVSDPLVIENLDLDTTPPSLDITSPLAQSRVNEIIFPVTGFSNEPLSALTINGIEVDLSSDNQSFSFPFDGIEEGPLQLNFVAKDLYGNTSSFTVDDVEIFVPIINKSLVTVEPSQDDPTKLIVSGGAGAVRIPNFEFELKSGLIFNKSVVSNQDGSFEVATDLFNASEIKSLNPNTNTNETIPLTYNIDTSLSGTVLDVNGSPLYGVKVTILSSGQTVLTDGNGEFKIENPVTGDQKIEIDATSIPEALTQGMKEYSVINLTLNLGTLQTNAIGQPIYLAPLIKDGTETEIEENSGAIVTSPSAPGVEIDIPAGVTSFPKTGTTGTINIAEVPSNRTSLEMPEFARVGKVYALEPSGVSFSEPVELTLPNENEFPPGMPVVIMSKNSEKGYWEIGGVAEVNELGNSIKTLEGAGISHFSEVYAVPFGIKVDNISKQDVPGANTFDGASSTSISLPTYKVLGQDFGMSLSYKSNWANPTAVIKNIIDVPRQERDISRLLPNAGAGGITKVEFVGKSWIQPDYITAKFFTSNIETEKIKFTGVPNKSTISYAVDLSSLDSGVYPYSAQYEVFLKQMILGQNFITIEKNILGKKAKKVVVQDVPDEIAINEAFPQDFSGTIINQNKIDSSVGRGWKINGIQKILNPNSPRIVIEEENGNPSTYSLNSTIENIVIEDDLIKDFVFNDVGDIRYLKDGFIYQNVNGENVLWNTLPKLTGFFTSSSDQCGAGNGEFCSQQEFCFFENKNFEKELLTSSLVFSEGDDYILSSEGQLYFRDHVGLTLIAGSYTNPPRFHTDEDIEGLPRFGNTNNFCNNRSDVSCITSSNKQWGISEVCDSRGVCLFPTEFSPVQLYPLGQVPGPTWNPAVDQDSCENLGYPSEGQWPVAGFADGLANTSRLNNPSAIIKGLNNNLLIVDKGNNKVRSLNLSSRELRTVFGNGQNFDLGDGGPASQASFYHPTDIVRDTSGVIYLSTQNGFIRKIDSNGIISTLVGQNQLELELTGLASEMRLNNPSGLALDETNNILFVSDTGHHRVVAINLVDNTYNQIAGASQSCQGILSLPGQSSLDSSLCAPSKLKLDESNNLLILDSGHKAIRRINLGNSNGAALAFIPTQLDNSSLLKLNDGSFIREYRDGTKAYFDSNGLHTSTESRNGRTITFSYNGEGNLVSVTDPTGSETQLTYFSGRLGEILDPSGRRTQFFYNGDNLEQVIYPDLTESYLQYGQNGLLTQETNQRGISTTYVYNSQNRISKVTRGDNSEIEMIDSDSIRLSMNQTIFDEGAPLTESGVEAGKLYDGIKDANGVETKFVQDENGFVSTIVDGEGRTTKITRNIFGDPTEILRPDNSSVFFEYNEDTRDLLSKTDSQTGVFLTYSYNSFGELIRQENENTGQFLENNFDALGNLLSRADQTGTVQVNTYLDLGLLSQSTDANGNTTKMSYDVFGNLSETTDPLGTKVNYQRDFAGNAIEVLNSKGQKTENTYDSFNRLTSVRSPKGELTTYQYLNTGELAKIIDPRGNETIFEYDVLGRLGRKTDPLGRQIELFYDGNGNVVREIDYAGNEKVTQYDSLNRVIKRILPDNVYDFEYDIRSNITKVSNDHSAIEYTYVANEAGYLISRELVYGVGNRLDLPSHSISYEYNEMGKRTFMQSAVGETSYAYDLRDRLTQINNHRSEVFGFAYDQANRLVEISRPGSNTFFEFDSTNFLTKIQHEKQNASVIDFVEYSRDAIGNRTQKRTARGIASYNYDSNNQLESTSDTLSGNESFSYDPLGNRISDSQGNYIYEGKFQQLVEGPVYKYVYDLNGNLSTRIEKSNETNFSNYLHDTENRLREVHIFENNIQVKNIKYTYDPLGRRIEKDIQDLNDSQNNKTRRYVYDLQEIHLELNETNEILAEYTSSTLRTDDMLSLFVTQAGVDEKRAKTSGSSFYLKDGLGSTTSLIDSAGEVLQNYDYSSFGELVGLKGAQGRNLMADPKVEPYISYTGREYDSETGHYHYRARVFDSSAGRFLEEDPFQGIKSKPISVNLKYVYTLNNPINYTDPEGEWAILAIGLGVGLIQGFSNYKKARDNGHSADKSRTSFFFGFGAGFTVGVTGGNPIIAGIVSTFHNAANQKIFSDNVDWGSALTHGLYSGTASYLGGLGGQALQIDYLSVAGFLYSNSSTYLIDKATKAPSNGIPVKCSRESGEKPLTLVYGDNRGEYFDPQGNPYCYE